MIDKTLPTSAETYLRMSGTGQLRSIEARAIDAHVRAVVREMLAENAPTAKAAARSGPVTEAELQAEIDESLAEYRGKTKEPVTTFDFEDGNGPVPAHKHPNGGGWVADTAKVAHTAYVDPDATVFGNASVSGYAWVYEHASVSENARVMK